MASDPVAVTLFDLDALPGPTGSARPADMHTFAADGEIGFADVWIAHLGGLAMAERHVRLALGPVAKRANEQHIDLVAGMSTILPAPDRGDVLAARLGLRTLIHHRARTVQHNLPVNLLVALVHGLDVETVWTKRNRMWDAARAERGLRGTSVRGKALSKTDIVGHVARWHKLSKASVWNTLALDLSTNHAKAHVSDPWFEAGKQDAVAIELIRRLRAGVADHQARWDLYNLMEGFYARRLFPSDHALIALDHALGLASYAGTTALADVVRRDAFMALADYVAAQAVKPSMTAMLDALASFDDVPDSSTVWRWVRGPLKPLFWRATELIRSR